MMIIIIVHSGTKQRNILQTSEIKIHTMHTKIAHPPPLQNNDPSLITR